MSEQRIVWKPQQKQREFMRRGEYEAFYGGAAGGGKSDALVMEALRQVHIPNYKGLILRKTYPMLRELIQKSQLYYPQAFPKARYNGTEHYWTFPSGAKILFGNVKPTSYQGDYQGQQYDFIGFDELTHFTWEEYSYFFSRNRASGAGTVCYVRATGNPGGIGHGWVKERFISAAPPGTRIVGEVNVDAPDGKKLTYKKSRIFIPSSVFDNPALIQNNPEYLSALASLPYAQKQALLYGNWDSFVGQVFMEWVNNPEHYQDGTNTHVIDPFPIPRHWQIVRAFDWGHAKPFSVGWFAVDEDGRMYMIRELYGCKRDQPNTGVEWPDEKIAQEILRIEHEDDNLRKHRILGVADPAIGVGKDNYGAAAIMAREGCYFTKADNNRILGKNQIHDRLAFREDGKPMLQIFKSCVNIIKHLPALVYSQIDVEDVDTAQEDHDYDMLRYACCTHMLTQKPREEKKILKDDPLNMNEDLTGRRRYFRV